MSKIHLETLTFTQLLDVGYQLQNELRNAENEVKNLKEFHPYLLDDEYDNLPQELKRNYCKASVLSNTNDESEDLNALNFNLHLMLNLDNRYRLMKASKKVKQLQKKVKEYNGYIKLKYNW